MEKWTKLKEFQETLDNYFPDPSNKNSKIVSPVLLASSPRITGNPDVQGKETWKMWLLVCLMITCPLGIFKIATDEFVYLIRSRLDTKMRHMQVITAENVDLELFEIVKAYDDWRNAFVQRTEPLFPEENDIQDINESEQKEKKVS